MVRRSCPRSQHHVNPKEQLERREDLVEFRHVLLKTNSIIVSYLISVIILFNQPRFHALGTPAHYVPPSSIYNPPTVSPSLPYPLTALTRMKKTEEPVSISPFIFHQQLNSMIKHINDADMNMTKAIGTATTIPPHLTRPFFSSQAACPPPKLAS
ncbi:hypothetical protein F5Y15DRAFT_120968 [Xylariaceae sp. FL0016]|nr:hypothetical protein F5Y15DRAFT_120968 [Xylariaceae sp. FL0016]